jgi:hypothetical protein
LTKRLWHAANVLASSCTPIRWCLLILACSILPLTAAPRVWKDPDSPKTIKGEYVSRDAKSVTIRRADGLVFSMNVTKLHPDDRQWLDANHPLPNSKPVEPVADKSAVFDTLHFGDTRQQVLAKLKASTLVELGVDETFLGRLGLNGTFQTRKDIGGLRCLLFFDWSEAGAMNELSLQTSPLAAAAYPTRLKACWEQLIKLLTTLYGAPLQNANYPAQEELTDGAFLATHLWRLEGGGSVLLGTAREDGSFTTVVRFTQRDLTPVRIP